LKIKSKNKHILIALFLIGLVSISASGVSSTLVLSGKSYRSNLSSGMIPDLSSQSAKQGVTPSVGQPSIFTLAPSSSTLLTNVLDTSSVGFFGGPREITVDSKGDIFVVDFMNKRVQEFDQHWNFIRQFYTNFSNGMGFYPTAVAVNSNNNTIYIGGGTISYGVPSDIAEFNITTGALIADGLATNVFYGVPVAMAIDSSGYLYVATNGPESIYKLNATGYPVAHIGFGGYGTRNNGLFIANNHLYVARSSSFYLCEASQDFTGCQFQEFALNGTLVTQWGNNTQFGSPSGIAVDSQGNVYMTVGNQIFRFSSNGTILDKFGGQGQGLAEFFDPQGLFIDSQGMLYVADYLNDRILRFSVPTFSFVDSFGRPTFYANNVGGYGDNTFQGFAMDAVNQSSIYVADTGPGGLRLSVIDPSDNLKFRMLLPQPPGRVSADEILVNTKNDTVYIKEDISYTCPQTSVFLELEHGIPINTVQVGNGFFYCPQATGLGMDQNGYLYTGLYRYVFKLNASLAQVSNFSVAQYGVNTPVELKTDAAGNIYEIFQASNTNSLLVFSNKGNLQYIINPPSPNCRFTWAFDPAPNNITYLTCIALQPIYNLNPPVYNITESIFAYKNGVFIGSLVSNESASPLTISFAGGELFSAVAVGPTLIGPLITEPVRIEEYAANPATFGGGPGTTISGIVTDTNGNPLANVSVYAISVDALHVLGPQAAVSAFFGTYNGLTDVNGRYSITVPAGTYYVEAQPPPNALFSSQWYNQTYFVQDATNISVPPFATSVNFTLPATTVPFNKISIGNSIPDSPGIIPVDTHLPLNITVNLVGGQIFDNATLTLTYSDGSVAHVPMVLHDVYFGGDTQIIIQLENLPLPKLCTKTYPGILPGGEPITETEFCPSTGPVGIGLTLQCISDLVAAIGQVFEFYADHKTPSITDIPDWLGWEIPVYKEGVLAYETASDLNSIMYKDLQAVAGAGNAGLDAEYTAELLYPDIPPQHAWEQFASDYGNLVETTCATDPSFYQPCSQGMTPTGLVPKSPDVSVPLFQTELAIETYLQNTGKIQFTPGWIPPLGNTPTEISIDTPYGQSVLVAQTLGGNYLYTNSSGTQLRSGWWRIPGHQLSQNDKENIASMLSAVNSRFNSNGHIIGCSELEQVIATINLFDPSGYVTDAVTGAPIQGANVTLYVFNATSQQFVKVTNPSYFTPSVNPEETDPSGAYGWDVAPGEYIISVQAPGYYPKNSSLVTVPPAITDLNISLTPLPKPTTTLMITGGTLGKNDWYTSPTVEITLNAKDNAGVEAIDYIVDGGAVTISSPPSPSSNFIVSFELSGDGIHNVTYWAVGANGVTESPVTTFVKIDSALPVISVGNLQGSSPSGTIPIITAYDSISGISSLQATLDGQPYSFFTPVNIVGIHNLTVIATNVAGNSIVKSFKVVILGPTTNSVPEFPFGGLLGALAPAVLALIVLKVVFKKKIRPV